MRILIYGAGVQGSLYAAWLCEAGHAVTVLARGERLDALRAEGIILEEALTQKVTRVRVDVAVSLEPDAEFDLIVVAVRCDQIGSVLPPIGAARRVPVVMFLHNHAGGSLELLNAIGAERVVLGFPGAGGVRAGAVVRYVLIPQQPTTVGEPSGRCTARLRMLEGVLRHAGFPTRCERHMDAWLNAHAVFVTAVAGAIYLAGGDTRALAADRDAVARLVRGVREGFSALVASKSGAPPANLRAIFQWAPEWVAVWYWRRYMAQPLAQYAFGGHVGAAPAEMDALAREVARVVHGTTTTPTLDALWAAIAAHASKGAPNPPAALP
jgi:2-dehydropantoate 2-reductase